MGKAELLGVLELFQNSPLQIQNFELVCMKLETIWQNNTTKYKTINIFWAIISLQNMFLTVQRIRVIWMLPFQGNISFGAVHSADEKHLSADTTVVGIPKDLINIFYKTRKCIVVCG